MSDRNREPSEHYAPVELTDSAKRKLPAAKRARKARDKKGALGKASRNKSRARSALDMARKNVR